MPIMVVQPYWHPFSFPACEEGLWEVLTHLAASYCKAELPGRESSQTGELASFSGLIVTVHFPHCTLTWVPTTVVWLVKKWAFMWCEEAEKIAHANFSFFIDITAICCFHFCCVLFWVLMCCFGKNSPWGSVWPWGLCAPLLQHLGAG